VLTLIADRMARHFRSGRLDGTRMSVAFTLIAFAGALFFLTSPSLGQEYHGPGVCVNTPWSGLCDDEERPDSPDEPERDVPSYRAPSKSEIADRAYVVGKNLLAEGRYTEAEQQFRSAIAFEPGGKNGGVYHNLLGTALALQQRYDEAIAAYRQALELDPNENVYYWNTGHAYWKSKRYEDALPYYQKAAQLGCGDECKADLAKLETYLAQKRQAQALEEAQREQQRYWNAGLAYWHNNHYEEALPYLQKAVQLGCETCKADLFRLEAFLEQAHQEQALDKQMMASTGQISNEARSQSSQASPPTPGAGGLDFVGQNGFFGVPEGVQPKDSGLVVANPDPAVTSKNAREQLANLDMDSRIAKRAGSLEQMKHDAGCGSAADPCHEGDAVFAPIAVNGQTPAGAALATRIPDQARKDTQVQQSFAWFQRLDALRIDAERQAAEINRRIKKGGAGNDRAALVADLGSINNQLQQIAADQSQAKDQIKKRLVDLSLEWKEASKPTTSPAKAAQPSTPK